jgi:hypothetical protein
MSQGKPDLTPGSVLHIKNYSSRGHSGKDKYLLIIGSFTESEALGVLISSQLSYLHQESHKAEVVRIPDRATSFLRHESIIQCFELEYLSVSSLREGFEQGAVTNQGRLPIRYLHRVREAVSESRLLSQLDIERALKILPGGEK